MCMQRLSTNSHLQQQVYEGKAAGREDSGLWMPRADAGGPRRTDGYACYYYYYGQSAPRMDRTPSHRGPTDERIG